VRDRLRYWNLVKNEAATDFFHGDALSLVREGPVLLPGNIIVAQANTRSAPQLFRAHGRDINVEESTFDWRRLGGGNWRCGLFACLWRASEIDCVGHTKED
jgi:hypothetical protein